VACLDDCDDTNPLINPATYWHPDVDGDNYGNPAISLQQCSQPAGFVLDNTDCDDNDSNIYPSGPHVRIIRDRPYYYSTLQDAFNLVTDFDIIQNHSTIFTENLIFNKIIQSL
jgi:hypothetical protein